MWMAGLVVPQHEELCGAAFLLRSGGLLLPQPAIQAPLYVGERPDSLDFFLQKRAPSGCLLLCVWFAVLSHGG